MYRYEINNVMIAITTRKGWDQSANVTMYTIFELLNPAAASINEI